MRALCPHCSRFSNLVVDGAGLIAVIALALFVRLHAITVPTIWYDEAFSLLLARETPWQIWAISVRDVHPPLYYVLLHYWMSVFGNSVFSARSLSALVDVGTLLFCIKLISLVATRRATWIAALLLALLPISVRYSQEVRMYTLLGFWLIGATVALVCWVKVPNQKRYSIFYVLLMTTAFYTHYFAALCVLVHWLFWWRARGVQGTVIPVRAWILANSAIVLLYLPWLPNFLHQLLGVEGQVWAPPVTWQTVLTIVWQFTVMNIGGAESSIWRVLPLGLIVVCALAAIFFDSSKLRFSGLLVGYFFVPALVLSLLALIVPVFIPRYLMFAAVGLPMICAVAVDSWGRQRTLLVAAAVVFFVMVQLQGLRAVYSQEDGLNGTGLRKDFRLDTLAAEINRQARPNDAIVFDTLILYLPFRYYNKTGIQPRFYIKSSMDEFRGNIDQGGYALIPQHLKWIFFNDVGVLKLDAGRIWWVTGKPQPEDVVIFPMDWKQTMTIKGGEVEARLFILGSGH